MLVEEEFEACGGGIRCWWRRIFMLVEEESCTAPSPTCMRSMPPPSGSQVYPSGRVGGGSQVKSSE